MLRGPFHSIVHFSFLLRIDDTLINILRWLLLCNPVDFIFFLFHVKSMYKQYI